MPAVFESFGVRFLYPDNWTVASADDSAGVMIEMPGGGVFAVEPQGAVAVEEASLLGEIERAIAAEYDELEREEVSLEDEQAVEFRFYYLDLLIVSRVVFVDGPNGRLLVQMQAESREFERNELVFAAILKQIRNLVR